MRHCRCHRPGECFRRRSHGFAGRSPLRRAGAGGEAGFALTTENSAAVDGHLPAPRRLAAWPSSWPRRACGILSPGALLARLDQRPAILTGGPATFPSASRRSARPSPGATTCSEPAERSSSPGLRSSSAAARWKRPWPSCERAGASCPSICSTVYRLVQKSLLRHDAGPGDDARFPCWRRSASSRWSS